MSNKLTELMQRDDRGARLAKNLLTRAFRDMLKHHGITEERLTTLMEVYLRSPSRQIEDEVRNDPTKFANKLANDRGNLKKEIEKDEYTFKVFLKLVELLRPKEFSISFHALWHDGFEFNATYQDILGELDLSDVDEIEVKPEHVESFKREMERYHASAAEKVETATMKDVTPVKEDKEAV